MCIALLAALAVLAAPVDRFNDLMDTLQGHRDSSARVAALDQVAGLKPSDASAQNIEGAIVSALVDRTQRRAVRDRAIELLVEFDTASAWQTLRRFGESLPAEIKAAEAAMEAWPEEARAASTREEREAAQQLLNNTLAWHGTARHLRQSMCQGLGQRRGFPEADVILLLCEDLDRASDLTEGVRALLAQDLRHCMARALELTIDFERRNAEALARLADVKAANPDDPLALMEARADLGGFDVDLGILLIELTRFTQRHEGMAPPPSRPWTDATWAEWSKANLALVPVEP